MSTKACAREKSVTPKQLAILEWIRKHQPVSGAQIAERFDISASTVTVHMMFLARAELAWCTGRAKSARWHAHKAEVRVPSPPLPIEQVASVWHYARRCAARG